MPTSTPKNHTAPPSMGWHFESCARFVAGGNVPQRKGQREN